MGDSTTDLISVVGYEDISLLDSAFPEGQKLRDETAKLSHQHLTAGVSDHVEFILLIADGRRPKQVRRKPCSELTRLSLHGTSQDHLVHLLSDRGKGRSHEAWDERFVGNNRTRFFCRGSKLFSVLSSPSRTD